MWGRGATCVFMYIYMYIIYSSVYLAQYGLTCQFITWKSDLGVSNLTGLTGTLPKLSPFMLWSELQVAGPIPCCSWDIGIWQWLCTKSGALGDKSKWHVCSMHHFLWIRTTLLLFEILWLSKHHTRIWTELMKHPEWCFIPFSSAQCKWQATNMYVQVLKRQFQNYILYQLRMPVSIVWHLLHHLLEGFDDFMPTSSDLIRANSIPQALRFSWFSSSHLLENTPRFSLSCVDCF